MAAINISKYENVPARALNMSTRNFLAHMLDRNQVSKTSRHMSMNWEGLAELLGFNYDDIQRFECDGKTKMVLHDYTMKGGDVARLLQCLQELERHDILEDVEFQRGLRKDVETFLSTQQQQMEQSPPSQSPPVQVADVTSAGHTGDMFEDFDEDVPLTIQDARNGTTNTYDAFVIYADEDFPFVQEMITQLEQKTFGLCLFISDRDMLGGPSQYQAIAAIIRKRCSKVIVVISPAFKRSSMCRFATNFAFSLCPGTLRGILVPILYVPCQIPDMLRYIAPLDFTKVEYIQWFWERLQQSLKPVHVTTAPSVQQEQPLPYEKRHMSLDDVDVIPCPVDEGSCSRDVGGAVAGPDMEVSDPGSSVLPSKMDLSGSVESLPSPSSSGRRKKPWDRIKRKTKAQTQKRHAHFSFWLWRYVAMFS